MAFQAVRKPVEGTILTVLRDSAAAAKRARKKKLSRPTRRSRPWWTESYASVQRTPDLLPVLKENGVVDAGGYGLAIFFDAFTGGPDGSRKALWATSWPSRAAAAPKVEIEQINDWEGSAYRYCTEFLVHSDTLDVDAAKDVSDHHGRLRPSGGHASQLQGARALEPFRQGAWLVPGTHDAQVSEVHIHNMQLQSAARNDALAAEKTAERKPLGFVAVAAGEGNAKILASLGVDEVVSGGQTMNPSTKDLLDAVGRVNADAVVILPNNSNIIMAAQTACGLSETPCAVVPTKSVPQAFAALFGVDEGASLEENVESMTEAFAEVKTGEVTRAIKDAKDASGNAIHAGDVIGIADGSIDAVGQTVEGVVMDLLGAMDAQDADTLTILAGEDMDDASFEALVARIEEAYEDLEVDAHRGEQPLYPVVLSVE